MPLFTTCGTRFPGGSLTDNPVISVFRDLPVAVLPPSGEAVHQRVHQIKSDGFIKDKENKDAFFGSVDDWKPWNGLESEPGVFLELSFVDSKGTRWRRDALGALSKLPHMRP